MVPTITTPIEQFAGSALLAVLLLSLGATILRADEVRPLNAIDAGPSHCRIYFGCLPGFAKKSGRFN